MEPCIAVLLRSAGCGRGCILALALVHLCRYGAGLGLGLGVHIGGR